MNAMHGVSLIELLVSIVIVSIAASGVLGVLSMTSASSADPMAQHQASAIAQAYIEEILLKPFDDPDGSDGESARADFDDVDDYDGLVDSGARNQLGNPITGLDSYTVSVVTSATTALAPVPSADAIRVDVAVARGSSINFVLSAYKTRF